MQEAEISRRQERHSVDATSHPTDLGGDDGIRPHQRHRDSHPSQVKLNPCAHEECTREELPQFTAAVNEVEMGTAGLMDVRDAILWEQANA